MVMRYHWGMAVGHAYTCTFGVGMPRTQSLTEIANVDMADDQELTTASENPDPIHSKLPEFISGPENACLNPDLPD
jgi:hypothetical protein